MKIKLLVLRQIIIFIFGFTIITGCNNLAENTTRYDDGLPRSIPEEQGVPSEVIASFFRNVEEKGYEVHGLMMIRNGKVIAEHWWAPYAPQYQHAMYSATKTFTAIAVGFAVQEGLLKTSDKVISFFPDLLPDTISSQLAGLTVKHLLSMSVGHVSAPYPGSGSSQVKSFLAAPFAHEPGTSFAYNITASHMLSHIITRVSGITILDYLKQHLFDPLGIQDVIWEMDNDGINMGNGGSHMKTSDLAKMGLFLINKGKWNGKQLLDPAWIEEATTAHIYQHPELTPEEIEKAEDDGCQGYGYQIWLGRNNSYRAIGGQNQLIMVIPEYNFILACHSTIGDEAGFNSLIYEMLPSFSDKKIKTNKSVDLNSLLSEYKLKSPFSKTNDFKLTMCTRRYQMEDNSLGIQSLLFRFDAAGNCHLTLVTQGAIHNIPFGLDDWLIGKTDRTLSFSRTVYPNPMNVTPVNTAGICNWTSANQLSAYYLSMFNPGSDETFMFTFEDARLKMEIAAPRGRRPGPPGTQQQESANLILTGSEIPD